MLLVILLLIGLIVSGSAAAVVVVPPPVTMPGGFHMPQGNVWAMVGAVVVGGVIAWIYEMIEDNREAQSVERGDVERDMLIPVLHPEVNINRYVPGTLWPERSEYLLSDVTDKALIAPVSEPVDDGVGDGPPYLSYEVDPRDLGAWNYSINAAALYSEANFSHRSFVDVGGRGIWPWHTAREPVIEVAHYANEQQQAFDTLEDIRIDLVMESNTLPGYPDALTSSGWSAEFISDLSRQALFRVQGVSGVEDEGVIVALNDRVPAEVAAELGSGKLDGLTAETRYSAEFGQWLADAEAWESGVIAANYRYPFVQTGSGYSNLVAGDATVEQKTLPRAITGIMNLQADGYVSVNSQDIRDFYHNPDLLMTAGAAYDNVSFSTFGPEPGYSRLYVSMTPDNVHPLVFVPVQLTASLDLGRDDGWINPAWFRMTAVLPVVSHMSLEHNYVPDVSWQWRSVGQHRALWSESQPAWAHLEMVIPMAQDTGGVSRAGYQIYHAVFEVPAGRGFANTFAAYEEFWRGVWVGTALGIHVPDIDWWDGSGGTAGVAALPWDVEGAPGSGTAVQKGTAAPVDWIVDSSGVLSALFVPETDFSVRLADLVVDIQGRFPFVLASALTIGTVNAGVLEFPVISFAGLNIDLDNDWLQARGAQIKLLATVLITFALIMWLRGKVTPKAVF